MNQHLLDVGAVRLVGWCIEPELYGTDDPAFEPRREQHDIA
jgi:hypothetical protein